MSLVAWLSFALAAPPLPLQGVFTSAAGAPLNGPHTLTTQIWTAPTAEATPTLAWEGDSVVSFDAGFFSSPIRLDPANVLGPTPAALQSAERVLVAVGVAGVGLSEPVEVGAVWRASRADSVPWSGVVGAAAGVQAVVENTTFAALSAAGLVHAGSVSVDGGLTAGGAINAASYSGGNTGNWNTAWTERRQWDGSATALDAALGRTSLGLGALATRADVAGGAGGTVADGTLTSADLATGAFPAITGVGTLQGLSVTGTARADTFRVRNPTTGTTELIEFGGVTRIHHDSVIGTGEFFSVAGNRPAPIVTLNNLGAGPALYVPNGNVGIGVASPTQRLDVAGSAHISGNLNVDGHTTSVAFSAHDSVGDWCKNCSNTSADSEGNQKRVVMNAVDINIGNAYNPSTGEMTAPTAGVYMICVNFLHGDQTDDYVNFRVWVNDNWPTSTASDHIIYSANDYIPWEYMHGCQMVMLNAGDRMGIQVYGSRGIYENPDENHERLYGWKL